MQDPWIEVKVVGRWTVFWLVVIAIIVLIEG